MPARPRKVYVVTAPPAIRGVYDTWAACEAAVRGVKGARFQAVSSRRDADEMLSGEGRVLPPGTWAFVDGNHLGGVGVVLVEQGADGIRNVTERALRVERVFAGSGIPGLESPAAVRRELERLRNVLTELGGLWAAIALVPEGATVTIVHDYEGVGAWIEGRWKAKDPVVAAIVEAARARIAERRLTVSFRHQAGHRSTWAARDDFAAFNARADALATEAGII